MTSKSALQTWKDRLEFLNRERAIAASADIKFQLDAQIVECEQKIRELSEKIVNDSSTESSSVSERGNPVQTKKNMAVNPPVDFNECRKTFVASLNSFSILSSLVFFTMFVPYTTYVGNLLAKRVEITKETKIIRPLNNEEKNGNFDLRALEKEWLKAHNPSVDVSTMLTGKFSFSKAEIVLIYPAAVSILLAYLSLHFYDLLNLKQKLKDEDEELVKIPRWRIAIASISLVFCLVCSWWIILCPPKIPPKNTLQSVKIESRLGKIIAKESSYQLTPDIDLWIFFPSLVFFLISVIITLKACGIRNNLSRKQP